MKKQLVVLLFLGALYSSLGAQDFTVRWTDSIPWDDGQLKYSIAYQPENGRKARVLGEAGVFPNRKFNIRCENAETMEMGLLKPEMPMCEPVKLTVELLKTGETVSLLLSPPGMVIEALPYPNAVTPGQRLHLYPSVGVNGETHSARFGSLLRDYFAVVPEHVGLSESAIRVPTDYIEPIYAVVLANRCNGERYSFSLPVVFNQTVVVNAAGGNGEEGSTGYSGNWGQDGRDGTSGSPGSPGKNGGRGGNVQLEIRQEQGTLFTVLVKGAGPTQTHILDFSKGAGIVVNLQGGTGGTGGKGGKGGGGGDGIAATDGHSGTNPGYGGNGGRGGDGGFGGNGGRLTVYADSAAMQHQHRITLNNAGGAGGEGGDGGGAGPGGSDPNSKRLIDLLVTGRRGSSGLSGRDGQPGMIGPAMEVRRL